MSLDIGSALKQGAQRTFEKNGLIIAGLLFLAGILNTVFSSSLFEALGGVSSLPEEAVSQIPFSLGLSLPVSGLLLLLTTVASAVVTIAAVRTFVSNETEAIPKEFFTRNLGPALLNLFIGGIVFAAAVGIGLIAFIIPGIFLLVSLYFWNVFVIVEDQNFVESFKSSWSLTEGSRLQLLGLGVMVTVIGFIVGAVTGLLGTALTAVTGQAISIIIQQAPNALLSAFSIATLAQAYNQLKE